MMKTVKYKFYLIFAAICLLNIPVTGQDKSDEKIYRGWYQFHHILNRMQELRVQDKVDIIFALQDALGSKLPIDYLWTSEQIDGLRSLILMGFSFELPADKIAGACVTLFDAYQLGAIHPNILEFFELLLTEKISAERLVILSKSSQGMEIFADDIKMQILAEIIQNDWQPRQIGAAVRCLRAAKDRALDLRQVIVGIVVTISQVNSAGELDTELSKMLDIVQTKKEQAQKSARFTAVADSYRKKYLPDAFIDNLLAEAVDSGWREESFRQILNTLNKAAKNGLPFDKLATAIIIRLSQHGNLSAGQIRQICAEEYQAFYQKHMPKKKMHFKNRAIEAAKSGSSEFQKTNSATEIDSERILKIIESYLGTPYRYGGTSHSGIDCSGLTQNIYRQCGVNIPRTCRSQFRTGNSTHSTELQAGDLVFFAMNFFGYVSHVGIYIGNNQFCHASCRRGVTISNLNKHYYRNRFVAARRYGN